MELFLFLLLHLVRRRCRGKGLSDLNTFTSNKVGRKFEISRPFVSNIKLLESFLGTFQKTINGRLTTQSSQF
jgi:hypothetical protein